MMRIIIVGQLFFIIGTFFTALLQSYNHFFIPGIAAALYNLGIIVGISGATQDFSCRLDDRSEERKGYFLSHRLAPRKDKLLSLSVAILSIPW